MASNSAFKKLLSGVLAISMLVAGGINSLTGFGANESVIRLNDSGAWEGDTNKMETIGTETTLTGETYVVYSGLNVENELVEFKMKPKVPGGWIGLKFRSDLPYNAPWDNQTGYLILIGNGNNAQVMRQGSLESLTNVSLPSGMDLSGQTEYKITAGAVTAADGSSVNIILKIDDAVVIDYKPETYFEEYFFDCTGISEETHTAAARFFYKIHTNEDLLSDAKVRISGFCGDSCFSETRVTTFIAGAIYLEIPNAYLWWPKNYGKPNQYRLKAEFILNGETVCEAEWKSGLRIVEIDRSSADGKDHGFCIKVNHTPIFVMGTNWVPLDVFHSRDPQRLEQALKLLDDIQCNMVRCWGGNVYEDHDFFDACDEMGIMVWQDFAMACGLYPQNEDFYTRIRQEAEIIVKRLRRHPSLTVWCGDNECDLFAAICYGYTTLDPNSNQITRRILPEVLAQNAPGLPYLPSSPYIIQKGLPQYAEDHLWGPRNYFKSYYYDRSSCCFASEIGYHGCPSAKSVKKFIDTEHLWPYQGNTQWFCHATAPVADPDGNFNCRIDLMADQVKEFFGVIPDHLERFSLFSQIVQAEAMKHFIENFRAAKWEKTGLIWWNLIDGWPQFSDAVVDYYFEKKLAFDFIKRAQQPVCMIAKETDGWNRQFVICNDTVQKVSCRYQIIDLVTDQVVNAGQISLDKGENRCVWETRCFSTEKTIYFMK